MKFHKVHRGKNAIQTDVDMLNSVVKVSAMLKLVQYISAHDFHNHSNLVFYRQTNIAPLTGVKVRLGERLFQLFFGII